ncbi:MAG: aminopeptidase P family protein [Planctomycetales bacterium]|nr:aminopeptidase P family protein [Planctomycetales bacterium]
MEPQFDCERRRQRLVRLLKNAGADAMLVTGEANVRYLTGFTGDSTYLLLGAKQAVMLSDFRYITQLEDECPDLEVEIRGPGSKLLDLVAKVVAAAKVKRLAIEADIMSVAVHAAIAKKLDRVELVSTSGLVEGLRMIKDAEEIALIKSAVQCAERAFSVVRASLRPEQTEKQVADAIEQQVRLFGGECTSFPPIVGVGPGAALPHYRPGHVRIDAADFVLIDWGARFDGYASDLTRVLVTGKISPKLQKVYEVVATAQARAIEKIKAGVSMQEVDDAARGLIAQRGYGKRFGHGLGHGIGLAIHEDPRLGPNEDRALEAGMVITIEPGVYLPGWGGVRLEDDVLVTRKGAEVLTSCPRNLEECIVDGR